MDIEFQICKKKNVLEMDGCEDHPTLEKEGTRGEKERVTVFFKSSIEV